MAALFPLWEGDGLGPPLQVAATSPPTAPVKSASAHVLTTLSFPLRCPWRFLWEQSSEGESRRQTPKLVVFFSGLITSALVSEVYQSWNYQVFPFLLPRGLLSIPISLGNRCPNSSCSEHPALLGRDPSPDLVWGWKRGVGSEQGWPRICQGGRSGLRILLFALEQTSSTLSLSQRRTFQWLFPTYCSLVPLSAVKTIATAVFVLI